MGTLRGLGDAAETGWEWAEAHRVCLRWAHRYASRPCDAEDIAQDALLRAWRRRASLRDHDSRDRWLATIVRNEAFRRHARPHPDLVASVELGEGAEDERVLATAERADLQAALRSLSGSDRRLLEMRYAEDLTQSAIAIRLGIPEGTVKVRLHRARHRLRAAYPAG